jgi:hypothetical protein
MAGVTPLMWNQLAPSKTTAQSTSPALAVAIDEPARS